MIANFCPFSLIAFTILKLESWEHSLNWNLNITFNTLYSKIKYKASMGVFAQWGFTIFPSSKKMPVYFLKLLARFFKQKWLNVWATESYWTNPVQNCTNTGPIHKRCSKLCFDPTYIQGLSRVILIPRDQTCDLESFVNYCNFCVW